MVQSIKPNLTIPIPTCRIQRKSFGFQPKRSLMRIYCRIWRQTLNVLKTFTNRNFKSDHSRVSDMLIQSKELRHSEDIVERNPYPHIIWEAVRSWRWRWEGQAVVTFFFPWAFFHLNLYFYLLVGDLTVCSVRWWWTWWMEMWHCLQVVWLLVRRANSNVPSYL